MSEDAIRHSASPPLVALAGWLVPGAGYWLIGQRARGMVIGVTIISLFILGLLVGGVRVVEVPMYDANGQFMQNGDIIKEIRGKPWSVPQFLAGPLSIGAGAWSVYLAQPSSDNPDVPRAPVSHVHSSEIAALYLSVAGLLNLLAILDSAYRARGGGWHA